jgi:branched-chain amino acid transport system permease protein
LSFLILVLMTITMSSSWNIMGGYSGYYNFGHGGFFGIGAYVCALVLYYFGLSFVSLPLAAIAAALVAIATGYPALRLKGLYFCLVTMAMPVIFMLFVQLTPDITMGSIGIYIGVPIWFGILGTGTFYYELFLAIALMTILVAYKCLHSKLGIGLVAIRQNEEAARALGVPTTKMKIIAYTIAAIPPAMVGGMYAFYIGYIDPVTVFAASWTTNALGASILGGLKSATGPVIGAIILITLSENLKFIIGAAVPGLNVLIYVSIVVAVVLLAPQGIVGVLRKYNIHLP